MVQSAFAAVISLVVLTLASLPCTSYAEVVRVAVESRADVAGGVAYGSVGPYERISGRLHFEVDPSAPANAAVADIDFSPRNAAGRVAFSADFFLLKPKDAARGNGTLLFEVSNRGGKGMLSMLNRAAGTRTPSDAAHFGDGFLLRDGYTLLWVGWQFDVPPGDDVLRVYVPQAAAVAGPLTGLVRSDFVVRERVADHSLADRNMTAYPATNPSSEANVLSVRGAPLAEREIVPRHRWRFARLDGERIVDDPTRVFLEGGFEPHRIYEVVYESENPPLAGLGLAAVRDAVSLLKHEAVPDVGLDDDSLQRAIAFGISQSGRLLRTFLYEGFNEDERQRIVFDGVMPHIAGGGRGSFNHRFAQPSRASWSFFYPNALFPFADTEQRDGDRRDGLLASIEPRFMPKIMYTNSSNEYWRGSAALTHVSPDGSRDLELPDEVRMYFFAGTQHVPAAFPPSTQTGQQPNNPNDYAIFLRALLTRMNAWVSSGEAPPASRYPMLRDSMLAALDALEFPQIPGVNLPQNVLPVHRLDHGDLFRSARVPEEPPSVGPPFPLLLPQVDGDGNEIAGLRSPELAVPLATYTGWSLYRRDIAPENELVSLQGSYIPFPRSRGEREASGDPRAAIEERYPSREQYLGRIADYVLSLVDQGYLLEEDEPWVLARAAAHWDYATAATDSKQ